MLDSTTTASPELCCGLPGEDPLPWRQAKEKGILKSSVIFTAPPVALLAPSWKKHKLFCTMFSVSALDSGSPDHLRIVLHPSGNCSHLPDHCHPRCQVQAFTKHHQQPPYNQHRAYGTALEHMEAFQ